MPQLVLGLWVATAFAGAYLFSHTLGAARSRAEAQPGQPTTGLPSLVLFVHPLFGLSGLLTWIAYLATGEKALAWTTLVVLVLGAGIGEVLLAKTVKSRKEPGTNAEDRIPTVALVTHGLFAAATIGVVLLVCLGVGDDDLVERYDDVGDAFAPGHALLKG